MTDTPADRSKGRAATRPGRRAARVGAGGFDWRLVGIVYLLSVAIGVARALLTAGTVPLVNDTDDAMRLVTVRDLLAGQGWWDHIQHRLDAPWGAEIHWSHLIDAGIGGLILLLRPLAGSGAETLAVYLWPLLLLLPLLLLGGALAFRLGGREAMLPALVLPLVSPALISEFSPGRIDHHSITILLTLAMVWGVVESLARPRLAAVAGLAAGVSLGIAAEGLPSVVCAIAGVALLWVHRPERAGAMRLFGVAFALATAAMLINQYPPGRWFEPACDEISIVYAAFAAGVGAVLVLLSVLPLGAVRPWQRLALGALLAAGLAAGLARAFPLCLAGPYAGLDPWLVDNWLNTIGEAKSLGASLADAPGFTLGIAFPPVLALVVMALRLWRHPRRDAEPWLVLGLFLVVALAVMAVQVRGARIATPLALPVAGWLVAATRQRYLRRRNAVDALALVGSWLGFAGLVIAAGLTLALSPLAATRPGGASTGGLSAAAATDAACLMPAAFHDLRALPAGRIMAPVDLGSHLLLYTPHAVVGAPYQRDQDGIRDTYRFFNAPIAQARQILAARGIGLVVVCAALPEAAGLPDAAPDSFVRLAARAALPHWLVPLSAPGAPLTVFRVAPP